MEYFFLLFICKGIIGFLSALSGQANIWQRKEQREKTSYLTQKVASCQREGEKERKREREKERKREREKERKREREKERKKLDLLTK
jgi:hypothetical protein